MKLITFVFWILLLCTVKGQFDKGLTLNSMWPRLDPYKDSLIQCISENHYDKIEFYRTLDTGQFSELPQAVTRGKPLTDSLLIEPASNLSSRFGAFHCATSSTSDFSEKTLVHTLKLPPLNQADLDAVSPYVSQELYDEVVFEVKVLKTLPLAIKWKHNTIDKPEWTGLTKVVINRVEIEDAGIYECYYEGRRDLGMHALIRLIVRHIYPRNPCYNGGVAEYSKVTRGLFCICPPGFAGEFCERACGGNKFGPDCNRFCVPEKKIQVDYYCAGHLFCMMDPYGCSCASGYKGSNCEIPCDPGWFGADCKQTCHCAFGEKDCDRVTGACPNGCLAGWMGDSCQMKACPENRYGEYCLGICSCSNATRCRHDDGKCFYEGGSEDEH